jgi:hypothetical protein
MRLTGRLQVTKRDNEYLTRILNEDVPRLRRQFARAIGIKLLGHAALSY